MTIPPSNVYHYSFVHNVLTAYYKALLDFFVDLYPRFEYKLLGTYDKAVAYLLSQNEHGREIDQPNLPAIILNPSGDFNFADPNTSAIQLWRFPNLGSGFIKRIYIPIYNDSNVRLIVGFSRIKGEIELINLVNSYYEYTDLRFLYMQFFSGPDRWVMPFDFNSLIILPDELKLYQYENDVTGESYPINWEANGFTQYLIKTTNRNEMAYPVTIKPIMKMTGISDNSDRYGGTDSLTDWKLGVTLEYEIEVPSYMFIDSNFCANSFHFDIRVGGYIQQPKEPEPNTVLSDCLTQNKDDNDDNKVKTGCGSKPPPLNNAPLNKIYQKHTIDTNAIIHNPNFPFKLKEKIHLQFYDRFYHVITKENKKLKIILR
ncbi:MAG: hypothetical protein KatS3mg002_0374 [Candidatus Woesearchaeota archaeon]|nr:MAG: hypothetical protein KatS3mg002_0374 [Candidatus Woesearchaeota archaeon]